VPVRRPCADPSVGLALEQCRGIPYVTDTLRTGGFVRFREPQIFAGVLICAGGAALTQWWGRQGMQPCTSGTPGVDPPGVTWWPEPKVSASMTTDSVLEAGIGPDLDA
jgi:hypothetical protein